MNRLEHFYYGQLIHHGVPIGDARVLARSKGVSDEQVQIALQVAQPPGAPNAPQLVWGVVRGNRETPYVLVHAQTGAGGYSQWHYILLTGDVPRALQGHIRGYLPLIEMQMPVFEMLGDTLAPLVISFDPQPIDQQADDLLELMNLTLNITRNLEPLINAVVTGHTLVVANAPADPAARTRFVQGLLTLLPSSTRFGVTFLLDSPNPESALITFSNSHVSEAAVRYDWISGDTSQAVENDYGPFITSQLRLDAGVAVRQAEALTQTAGWRFRNGDNLADALSYASQRSKVDQAVANGLPVEMESAARILADDPTLDEAARIRYARHLISFALALDDIEHVAPVALLAANTPALAKTIHEQLQQAASSGKSALVFSLLSRWLRDPLAPQSAEWVDLFNRAALLHLRAIVQRRDLAALKAYLIEIQEFPERTLLQRALPKIVEVGVPFAGEDAQLPTILMLLAMGSLDRIRFQQLLLQPNFARYLPKDIKRFLQMLPAGGLPAEDGALLAAVASVGASYRDEALMQFADMAFVGDRLDLLETPVLRELARVGATPLGKVFLNTLLNIARTISDEHLKELKPPAPRYILKMFATSYRYDLLLKAMGEQSRDLYGGERQAEYVKMLQEVFEDIPLPTADFQRLLDSVREYGIRDIPYLCIISGVLQSSGWSADLQDFADAATADLVSHPKYCDVIHYEAPLALLQYYLHQRSGSGVNQIAQLMPRVTTTKEDKEGLLGIRRTYQVLMNFERLHALAFEVLRQYVRLADPRPAQRIVDYYGKELGREARAKLQRAYDFSTFMDRQPLVDYAYIVEDTAQLIENALAAYQREKPTGNQIQVFYDTLRVRVDAATREKLGVEVMNFARSLALIARQSDARLSTGMLNGLAAGRENPRNIVDVFRVGGGKLLNGQVLPARLKQADAPTPFGEVPTQELYNRLIYANAVLRQPLVVWPSGKAVTWTAAAVVDELDSMLKMLPADTGADTAQRLGNAWQRLADFIPLFMKDVDSNILDADNRTGRKLDNMTMQPRYALEFFRYLAAMIQ